MTEYLRSEDGYNVHTAECAQNHYQELKEDVLEKNAVGKGLALNDLTSFRAPVRMVAEECDFASGYLQAVVHTDEQGTLQSIHTPRVPSGAIVLCSVYTTFSVQFACPLSMNGTSYMVDRSPRPHWSMIEQSKLKSAMQYIHKIENTTGRKLELFSANQSGDDDSDYRRYLTQNRLAALPAVFVAFNADTGIHRTLLNDDAYVSSSVTWHAHDTRIRLTDAWY
ncbi:hypothetical protein CBL_01110 [Carabus blaptoides fortunei]